MTIDGVDEHNRSEAKRPIRKVWDEVSALLPAATRVDYDADRRIRLTVRREDAAEVAARLRALADVLGVDEQNVVSR